MEEEIIRLENEISNSQDRNVIYEAIVTINKGLTSGGEITYGTIASLFEKSGTVIPRLIQFLGVFEVPTLQLESLCCLVRLAEGNSQQYIVGSGLLPAIVKLLLESTDLVILEQSTWSLAYIASQSTHYRDLIIQLDGIQITTQLLLKYMADGATQFKSLPLIRQASLLLVDLIKERRKPPFDIIWKSCSALVRLIYFSDEEAMANGCMVFRYLTDDIDEEEIQQIMDGGVCRRLVELLSHESPHVHSHVLHTITNLLIGNDYQTQLLINLGVVTGLSNLIQSPKKNTRKEVCYGISNITAGNVNQIQCVLDNPNIMQNLLIILQSEDHEIKREALWVISNIFNGGTNKQMEFIIKLGYVKPICQILMQMTADNEIHVVLETINQILTAGELIMQQRPSNQNEYLKLIQECNISDKIEELITHHNRDISQNSSKILEFLSQNNEEDIVDGVRNLNIQNNQLSHIQ